MLNAYGRRKRTTKVPYNWPRIVWEGQIQQWQAEAKQVATGFKATDAAKKCKSDTNGVYVKQCTYYWGSPGDMRGSRGAYVMGLLCWWCGAIRVTRTLECEIRGTAPPGVFSRFDG